MSKKNVKLGVGVVKNLLNTNQKEKIEAMIETNRLSNEAVRFVLDSIPSRFMFEVSRNYKFEDIFSSFENYIKSDAALKLYNSGESSCVFHWLTDFPSSSDELIKLYQSLQDQEKKVLFKNVIYRERISKLNLSVRDKYLNCYKGVLEIIRMETDKSINDSIEYYIYWAPYLSKDAIKDMAKVCGEKVMDSLLYTRLERRMGNYQSKEVMTDLMEILDYLEEANKGEVKNWNVASIMFKEISPHSWYIANNKTKEGVYVIAKAIYEKHARKYIIDDLSKTLYSMAGSPLKVIMSVYAYEENEDVVNKIFLASVKMNSLKEAISEVVYLKNSKNINPKITPAMREFSEAVAGSWKEVLITEDITNAKQLIALKERLFPFEGMSASRKIDGFSSNSLLVEHIKLSEFSQEDINLISPYLHWRGVELREYFKDGEIPYEFLMSNKEKITDTEFITSTLLSSYSSFQIIQLVDAFPFIKKEDSVVRGLVKHLVSRQEEVHPKKMAELVRDLEYIQPIFGVEKNPNIDLQSILTYI